MNSFKQILVLCFVTFSMSLHASVITYEKQGFIGNFSNADLKTKWYELGQVDSSTSLDKFDRVFSGNYTFSHLVIDIDMKEKSTWTLEAGLDAGLGAQVYIDDVSVFKDNSNFWWSYNWNHPDVIRLEDIELTLGVHKIELFWLENCCNGYNSVRFTDQSRDVTSLLSLGAIELAQGKTSVPEPHMHVVMGLALLLFGCRLRKQKADAI